MPGMFYVKLTALKCASETQVINLVITLHSNTSSYILAPVFKAHPAADLR